MHGRSCSYPEDKILDAQIPAHAINPRPTLVKFPGGRVWGERVVGTVIIMHPTTQRVAMSRLFFGIVVMATMAYIRLVRNASIYFPVSGILISASTYSTELGWANATPIVDNNITSVIPFTENNHNYQHPPEDIVVTKEKEVSFCFIVSVYGQWAAHVDRLQRVDKLSWYNRSQFFAFTNLPNLECKGWTKILLPLNKTYRRYITQSRYAKFFAWNDTTRIQDAGCQVVFYMDTIGHIRNFLKTDDKKDDNKNESTYDYFASLSNDIFHSPQGHAQYLHKGGGGAFGEFRRIEVFSKDVPENIVASVDWMKSLPDFRPPSQHNCTLYENRCMGYAVRSNTTFAKTVTDCFWPRYSLEVDSWRDQPLWCYCLDKYHYTPLPLSHHEDLWQLRPHRMGKKMKHRYKSESTIPTITSPPTFITTSS